MAGLVGRPAACAADLAFRWCAHWVSKPAPHVLPRAAKWYSFWSDRHAPWRGASWGMKMVVQRAMSAALGRALAIYVSEVHRAAASARAIR
jgi:hypothetical protein